ncbi:MAG TPA: hypothetical protein VGM20_04355 [Gemmatimonadales bacterium]|jgi:hypothetical protein
MSVASAKNKIFLRPSGLFRALDKASAPATTTLTAAAAKGATTFSVTSATGITAGKTFRIGEGENIERVTIQSVASLVITPTRPLMRNHDNAQPVVEMTVYDLGRIGSAGTFSVSDNGTDVTVEDRRLVYDRLLGTADIELATALVGLTAHTLAAALGIPPANVAGSGTHSAPWAVQTDGTEIGTIVNQVIIIQGTTVDGSPITIELWGADTDYTGVSLALTRGAALTVPCKWTAAAAGIDYNAVAITADTSLTSGQNDLLDSVDDIGVLVPATTGALATTLSAGASAGATTVSLTSVTNLAADDLLQLNVGGSMEVHRVNNPATTTLVTPLYRAQPINTAAVRLKQATLGGILKGSVKLDAGGSVDKMELENNSATIGYKPGDVSLSLSFSIVDVLAAVHAYALAASQTDAAAGRFTTEGMGTSPIAALYLQGKNLAGQTVLILLCGCSQQISGTMLNLQKKGVAGAPFKIVPGSVMQLTVYT